jgi:hypothetical protein
VATQLLTTLRRALTTASRRPGVSRLETTVDVTRPLPDGRDVVRLTVDSDSDDNVGGTAVSWQSPL